MEKGIKAKTEMGMEMKMEVIEMGLRICVIGRKMEIS